MCISRYSKCPEVQRSSYGMGPTIYLRPWPCGSPVFHSGQSVTRLVGPRRSIVPKIPTSRLYMELALASSNNTCEMRDEAKLSAQIQFDHYKELRTLPLPDPNMSSAWSAEQLVYVKPSYTYGMDRNEMDSVRTFGVI